MIRHLAAGRAVFLDLHLLRLVAFVPGRDVVLVAADGAFQDDLIAFGCHIDSLSFAYACSIVP